MSMATTYQPQTTSNNLIKLAKALNVRSEYFFRPTTVELTAVEYRKQAGTPTKLLNKINADVIEQAERWFELLDLYPDSIKPVPQFSLPDNLPHQVSSLEEVASIAETMRQTWALGLNPIHYMTDTLEAKGIMVIYIDVQSKAKFDGLAGTIGKTPLIVISTHQQGDHQRFTLAHELAHLILQGRLAPEMDAEQACNYFAGAFLLPQQALRQHLGNRRQAVEPQELLMIKHEYGLSMLAILERAAQCQIISTNTYKTNKRQFNKLGWRVSEPGEAYPNESTMLYKQLAYRALSEDYIGESKAAEILGIPLITFHKERRLEGRDCR